MLSKPQKVHLVSLLELTEAIERDGHIRLPRGETSRRIAGAAIDWDTVVAVLPPSRRLRLSSRARSPMELALRGVSPRVLEALDPQLAALSLSPDDAADLDMRLGSKVGAQLLGWMLGRGDEIASHDGDGEPRMTHVVRLSLTATGFYTVEHFYAWEGGDGGFACAARPLTGKQCPVRFVGTAAEAIAAVRKAADLAPRAAKDALLMAATAVDRIRAALGLTRDQVDIQSPRWVGHNLNRWQIPSPRPVVSTSRSTRRPRLAGAA